MLLHIVNMMPVCIYMHFWYWGMLKHEQRNLEFTFSHIIQNIEYEVAYIMKCAGLLIDYLWLILFLDCIHVLKVVLDIHVHTHTPPYTHTIFDFIDLILKPYFI